VLAQFRLGGLYEKGLGVKKDLEAAKRLYTSAAEAGNAKAMHNLAVLYVEGIGGKTDYATAAKWFRQAADYGLADSQYNLGILYARGLGVETNPAEAYKWFALAARDGDKEAASKRDDVGARLDPRLLAAAKLELESWSAIDQPEAATQAFVPSGGWDPVIPTPPSNPKPRAGAVKGETSQAAR
jgi:localization factor PodJL